MIAQNNMQQTDKQKAELGDPFAAYRLARQYQRRYFTLLKTARLARATNVPVSQDCIDNCAIAKIKIEYYMYMAAALAKYTGQPKLRTHVYEKIAQYNI